MRADAWTKGAPQRLWHLLYSSAVTVDAGKGRSAREIYPGEIIGPWRARSMTCSESTSRRLQMLRTNPLPDGPAGSPAGRPHRWEHRLPGLLLAIGVAFSGCSEKNAHVRPGMNQVVVNPVNLSGRVALIGQRTSEAGERLGTFRVNDGEGVPVHISGSGGYEDTDLTNRGRYFFRDLDPGIYAVYATVLPGTEPSSLQVEVGEVDVVAPDTLVLQSTRGLTLIPNPCAGRAVEIGFTTQAVQTALVEVRDISGRIIWFSSLGVPPGQWRAHWAGRDAGNRAVADGAYWVAVQADGVWRQDLVFWRHANVAGFVVTIPHESDDGEEESRVVATCWQSTVVSGFPMLGAGNVYDCDVTFLAPDSSGIASPDTCEGDFLAVSTADPQVAVAAVNSRWSFRLFGRRDGSTDLVLRLRSSYHPWYTSPPMRLDVSNR
jgi:hypothetical protein